MITSPKPLIVWLGTGDLYRKCHHALEYFRKLGATLVAVDIVSNPNGLTAFAPDDFFVWPSQRDRARLLRRLARDHPALLIIANWPEDHLASVLLLSRYATMTVVAKPIDINLPLLERLVRASELYRWLLDTVGVHDQYLRRPPIMALRQGLSELHAASGFLQGIRLFIAERRSVNDEPTRLRALEVGIIYDLAVHAIAILLELTPPQLTWTMPDGHQYRRLSRDIRVIGCAKAQVAGCMLANQDAETFATIEFEVQENIQFNNGGSSPVTRSFPVLVVVGKGVVLDDGVGRDLKALELSFQGYEPLRMDLETNAISGPDLVRLIPHGQMDRRQRGLNEPLIKLADRAFTPSDRSPDEIPLFQSVDAAHLCLQLLAAAHTAASGKLMAYRPGVAVHDLINRLIASDQLNSYWRMSQAPTSLLIGEPPNEQIP
jgi:hypothetical protein